MAICRMRLKKKSLESTKFWKIFEFYNLMKVKNNANRMERYETKRERRKKQVLREPLEIKEKALVLAERLRKKDAPRNLYKSTKENISFFNREKKIIIKKILNVSDERTVYYYWVAPEQDLDKIRNERFIRQELFALNDQFV